MKLEAPCYPLVVLLASALIFTGFPATAHGQDKGTACFEGSPAFPVPEFAGPTNSTQLWPDNFKPVPANPSVPEAALPPERDSTGYNGFSLLGELTGLEFFNAIDIETTGNNTYLYMAYNSGWQIWDITGNRATNPFRVAVRDGWNGDFHDFQELPTEFYFLVWDIDAIDPPTGGTLVAVASSEPVGFSIWDAANKLMPDQLYQNLGHSGGTAVATANIGGRSYAFAGSNGGIEVYDLTRAREIGPCFEDVGLGGTPSCGGSANPVYRGSLSNWQGGRGRYVDILQVGGDTFLVSSDAFNGNIGLVVHEITDAPNAASSLRLSGLGTLVYGPDLFTINNRHYVSLVEFGGGTFLKIFDITSCLTNGTSCNFNDQELNLPTGIADFVYTQFSSANGRPFLYQGLQNLCNTPPPVGSRLEVLLDLTDIEGVLNEDDIIIGDSYTESFGGVTREINYWTYSYAQSQDGFSLFGPKHGMFHGEYFYRAAQGMFDVHEYTGDIPAFLNLVPGTNNLWLSSPSVDEPVTLNGSCSQGTGSSWNWTAQNATAGDPAPVVANSNFQNTSFTAGLCTADTYPTALCPDRTVDLTLAANCDGVPTTPATDSVTLGDPRPFFENLAVGGTSRGAIPSFAKCSQLSFTPRNNGMVEITGQPVTDWSWTVEASGQTVTCNATGVSGTVQGAGGADFGCTANELTWDTSSVLLDGFFADNFESGDTSRWVAVGLLGARNASQPLVGAKANKGVGSFFNVALSVGNDHVEDFGSDRPLEVQITNPGALGYGSPPITCVEDGAAAGNYNCTVNATNPGSVTRYLWEFEQSNGAGTTNCDFFARCEKVETLTNTTTFIWAPPNVDGSNYGVAVTTESCDSSLPSTPITVNNVTVVDPVSAPTVTSFIVFTNNPECSCTGSGCTCESGQATFRVQVSGDCDTLFFEWGTAAGGTGAETTGCTSGINDVTHTYAAGNYTVMPTVQACLSGACSDVKAFNEGTLTITP